MSAREGENLFLPEWSLSLIYRKLFKYFTWLLWSFSSSIVCLVSCLTPKATGHTREQEQTHTHTKQKVNQRLVLHFCTQFSHLQCFMIYHFSMFNDNQGYFSIQYCNVFAVLSDRRPSLNPANVFLLAKFNRFYVHFFTQDLETHGNFDKCSYSRLAGTTEHVKSNVKEAVGQIQTILNSPFPNMLLRCWDRIYVTESLCGAQIRGSWR